MAKESYSQQRIIGVTLLAWLAVLGFDFFLHGGLLAELYAKPSPFLLPPIDAFQRIPLGYLSFLIFEILLIWLMLRLEIVGWRPGMIFGLQVGALVWGAMVLGLFSISTISVGLTAGWFFGQMVEAGIGGLVTGAGLVTQRPLRLTLYVILFVIITFIITIILQTIGLAPAAK